MTDGFSLFWEEVGYKVAGREVKVIVEDSDPEPTGALTKVRRLIEQEKVHTVAGGLLAATGYAIAPYLEQNKIQNIYIRKVERVGGKLQNTVVHTYPNVSQFWTYNRDEYLKTPPYERNYPPCKFCG